MSASLAGKSNVSSKVFSSSSKNVVEKGLDHDARRDPWSTIRPGSRRWEMASKKPRMNLLTPRFYTTGTSCAFCRCHRFWSRFFSSSSRRVGGLGAAPGRRYLFEWDKMERNKGGALCFSFFPVLFFFFFKRERERDRDKNDERGSHERDWRHHFSYSLTFMRDDSNEMEQPFRRNQPESRRVGDLFQNEFREDFNQKHFVRNDEFKKAADNIQGDQRRIFIEFLERSCTAEFSGFLLYKELGRRLKNTGWTSRKSLRLCLETSETRRFLEQSLVTLTADLGFLTKNRQYTFFKPKFIIYATYLSEKIGYWRYISIYRHLQANPDDQLYPIFTFNWCQDENRHGDFFSAVLKAGWNSWTTRKPSCGVDFFCPCTSPCTWRSSHRNFTNLWAWTPQFNMHVIHQTNKTTRLFSRKSLTRISGFQGGVGRHVGGEPKDGGHLQVGHSDAAKAM